MFSIDYLEYPWEAIEQKIYQERMRYQDIYQVIEQYLSEHKDIIIGGSMGINLLLKKERTIDDFEYELYAENAFAQATQLINILAEKSDDPTLFLKTTIPNVKYQIFVDLRLIATFIRLSENAINMIEPIKVKSFDQKHNLQVLSPEIQLIDIYRALYSPSQADNWQNILYDESKLFKHMSRDITEKVGSDENQKSDEVTIGDRRLLETQLFKQFIAANENIVLIGEHALKILLGIEISTTVIQIISQNDIEEDFVVIEKITKNVLKRNIPIVKLTRELNIMKDFRIRRTTIKVGDAEFGQKEIMYIYNSAYYDLIPFNVMKSSDSFIQIGNPFVLLRFLLIDFWMLRWVKQLGSIDEKFAQQRLNSILQKMMMLRIKLQVSDHDLMSRKKKITIDPQYFDEVSDYKIFQSQSKEYIGFYDDEIISQKIFIKDLSKRFYDYYPMDYKKKFGQYRILSQ